MCCARQVGSIAQPFQHAGSEHDGQGFNVQGGPRDATEECHIQFEDGLSFIGAFYPLRRCRVNSP